MNILWIEDFGGGEDGAGRGLDASKETVVSIFGELLDIESISNKQWNKQYTLIDDKQHITTFCEKYSTFHKIILQRNYYEFNDYLYKPNEIESNNTSIYLNKTEYIVRELDVVVIDINLTNEDIPNYDKKPPGYENDKNFGKEAGFYIFNKLISLGFPIENICFLTGNADTDEYSKFKKICNKFYMQKPIAYPKNDKFKKLKVWLYSKNSERMQLKRAILDGVKFCREKVNDTNILFNDFDDLNTTPSLTLLARSIVHEWDNDTNARKPGKPNEFNCFITLLQEVRNKTSHQNILEQWDESDVALLFLISIRRMINFGDLTEKKYETKLLNIVMKKNSPNKNISLSESLVDSKKSFEDFVSEDNQICRALRDKYNIYNSPYNSSEFPNMDHNEFSKLNLTAKQYTIGNEKQIIIFSFLEQLLKLELDSSLLKERIYKLIWHCNKSNQKPWGDFESALFLAVYKKYK